MHAFWTRERVFRDCRCIKREDGELSVKSWDMECDVLVAGSGGGGLVGAYTAASQGLKTILIESTDKFGGTTAYSGSGMWMPTNPVLRRAGSQDTLEAAKTYYHAVVGDRTPRALQDAHLNTGHQLVAFFGKEPVTALPGVPLARLLRRRTLRECRRLAHYRRGHRVSGTGRP